MELSHYYPRLVVGATKSINYAIIGLNTQYQKKHGIMRFCLDEKWWPDMRLASMFDLGMLSLFQV